MRKTADLLYMRNPMETNKYNIPKIIFTPHNIRPRQTLFP